MTYIELIVVLGIFVAFSAVSVANYRHFQSRITLKTLTSDIALKVVEAQKNAMSGKWNIGASTTWKPSYGIYFDPASNTTFNSFVSFVDLSQNKKYMTNGTADAGELLDTFTLKKGNTISELKVFYQNNITNPPKVITTALHVTFTRPDGGATMCSVDISSLCPPLDVTSPIDYLQITILSSEGVNSLIKLYSSGRIQLN